MQGPDHELSASQDTGPRGDEPELPPHGVHAEQDAYGSRAALDRLDRGAPGGRPAGTPFDETARDPLTDDERDFITGIDGFYLATVSETGWPYVQFRGGPAGFVTAPDEHTIAWPDFRGNRQYISTGNLAHDGRAALIFLDYPRQVRLKVYGHAHFADVPGHPVSRAGSEYRVRVEREVRIEVSAYDWNCPRHITPRYSVEEPSSVLAPLRERVAELEAENRRLRAEQRLGAG